MLNSNVRPTIPNYVPEPIKTIIKQCWETEPLKRPTFSQIRTALESWRSNYYLEMNRKEQAHSENKRIVEEDEEMRP